MEFLNGFGLSTTLCGGEGIVISTTGGMARLAWQAGRSRAAIECLSGVLSLREQGVPDHNASRRRCVAGENA
jgi:hypothetical protein